MAEHIREGLQEVDDDHEEYLVAYDFIKSKPTALEKPRQAIDER